MSDSSERLNDTCSERLSELKPGQKATVRAVSLTLPTHERRRLMDLGILPGVVIEAVMRSAGGDPTAYQIRGTLIALRQEQSRWIQVCRNTQEVAQ